MRDKVKAPRSKGRAGTLGGVIGNSLNRNVSANGEITPVAEGLEVFSRANSFPLEEIFESLAGRVGF